MTLKLQPYLQPSYTEQQQICLFADVVGSTKLAHSLPHDAFAALMTQAVTLMLGVLQEHGSQTLPHQGDAVLGLWDEWQVSQALAAAQSLHDRLGRLDTIMLSLLAPGKPPQLQLRIGLASGLVCCGTLGGQPSAYGLPLHLARRLCSAALPGETLLCERVAALLPGGAAQPLYSAPLSGFSPTLLHSALPLTTTLGRAPHPKAPSSAPQVLGFRLVPELTMLSDVQMKIS